MWNLQGILITCLLVSCRTELRKLDDYIKHYDKLDYDTGSLHSRHLKTKRTLGSTPLELKFNALIRDFHLILSPSASLFTKSYTQTHDNGTSDSVDLSFIYDGTVKGEPGSDVHGAVVLGIFRGTVRIPGDTVYHIEPAYRFFGIKEARLLPYHSVIYKEEHIDVNPLRHKREADPESSPCALNEYPDWIVQQTGTEVNARNRRSNYNQIDTMHSEETEKLKTRYRRQLSRCDNVSMYRNTCILYLRSDLTLFNKFMEDLDNNEMAARDEIMSLFASHVTALNQIYNNAEFRPFNATSPCYQGIRFQIQRTKIMTNETEKCHDNLNKSAFCQPEISVGDFLNLNSLENHDEFCLAYTFTYRDFAKNTLGLSWIGTTSGSGGICEKYKPYTNKDKQIWKGLNTGVVSIVNYNKRVSQRVSELTFAHEVGHSLGSPHDNKNDCDSYYFGTSDPNPEEGNYLMYDRATQGNLPNNVKFSNCSSEKIAYFIDAVVNERNGKVNCFTDSEEAFCGNGIVEQGEECDCGYEEECTDVCCNPRRTGGQNNDLSCTRKINQNTNMKYECSPTQGPCCSKECSFVAASSSLICRSSTDCRKEQTCSGNSANCPESENKADWTYCDEYSRVCRQGFCTESLCMKVGQMPGDWEECSVSMPDQLTIKQKEQLCYLACRKKNGTDSRCYSTIENLISSNPLYVLLQEINTLKQSSGGVKLSAGSPCDNYKGYCDMSSTCRYPGNDTSQQDQEDKLVSKKAPDNMKSWISEYWWTLLLIGIALFGLLIGICIVMKSRKMHRSSSIPMDKPI